MAIPDFQSLMPILLSHLNDGLDHSNQEILESLIKLFGLTEEERSQLLPSGGQEVFVNRVAWAKSHLKQARLIESPVRATYRITDRGREALKKSPTSINIKYLTQYPEYQEFRTRKQQGDEPVTIEVDESLTPQERIDVAYKQLHNQLSTEILQKIKDCPAAFFERLVVDLLIAMGYGGSRRDAGKAIGRSGDGGIDGIINEDKLGLDSIYIQAKRWEDNVGRPDIQKFAGALQGKRAKKGVFITTSDFSKDAFEYVSLIETKIILINGSQLASFMIDHGVGVNTIGLYTLKRIDQDYFIDE
jgi:restriction system protein